MNAIDIFLLIAIAVVLVIAVRICIKNRKNHKFCSFDCENCQGCKKS